ncbi:hypothetical protein [Fluviicola taffensis]|uniref:Lipoprotein n=1 Tax=Fluviicola taffensis (strain DSM 16823 / NCIMB 13979 / RW262) TaxID=755732 RepID=F2IIY8_FLUTR|nr:hypothetical protein [Fluviicola taffensis]AEA43846.1 hypothetical protein Fluta_1859 [Fluviicola taffensis DSM 16823]
MKQHTLNWISFSLFFFLIFSCKKSENFIGLKTGKYQVEYTVRHPNGNVDYKEYTAFGPRMLVGKYAFDIKATDSTDFCFAQISYNQNKLSYLYLIGCSSTNLDLKITDYDYINDDLTIHYKANPYSDSTSGTVIFNLLEE